MGASLMAPPPPSSLAFLLGPDQRAQRNQGPLLLRRRAESAVDSLTRQQRGNSPSDRCQRGGSAQGKKRFEGMEQIRRGPGAIGRLVRRDQGGQPIPELVAERAQSQSVNPGDDHVCGKVYAPIGPLLLKLMQAGQVALDRRAISPPPSQCCAESQATNDETGRRVGTKH